MDPRHDQEILAVFAEEAREYARQLSAADRETVGRAIHGIKGAAGMMGFDALCRVIAEHERRYEAGDDRAGRELAGALGRFVAELVPERESFPPGDIVELGRYFEAEAAEHLQAIRRAIADLEAHRAGEPDSFTAEELRRALHTLKGAADSVGRVEIAQAAHLMEDLAGPPYGTSRAGHSRSQSHLEVHDRRLGSGVERGRGLEAVRYARGHARIPVRGLHVPMDDLGVVGRVGLSNRRKRTHVNIDPAAGGCVAEVEVGEVGVCETSKSVSLGLGGPSRRVWSPVGSPRRRTPLP